MTYNDLIYKIAETMKTYADLPLQTLRDEAAYGCATPAEIKSQTAGMSRGELLEVILIEEFSLPTESDFEVTEGD